MEIKELQDDMDMQMGQMMNQMGPSGLVAGGVIFIAIVMKIIFLILAIVLIVKFWRLCHNMEEMNRTIQFMAHDLKDLRESQKK